MSRGHIRCQGKGSWELKFDLGTDPLTGKRRTRCATFRGTKREAEAELIRLVIDKNQGVLVELSKQTVAEYLEYWLENYAQGAASAKTLERWIEIVEKQLIPALGGIPLKNLSPVHIQQYYTQALKDGRRDGKGGLSAQTIKHHHALLFQALKQAVAWRVLGSNPGDVVKPPKIQQKEIEFLSKEELIKLLKAAKYSDLYAPIMVMATTGMRRGELLALRWSDIDLERRILTANQSLEETKKNLRFKSPKTRNGRRSITLPALTVSALKQHKIRRLKIRLSLGLRRDDDLLIFSRTDGAPIRPRIFSQGFKRLVRKLDLPPITLHGLRHTHISHLLMDGVHVKVVPERAGHSNISITLDRYSHVIPNMQEDAAKVVDSHLWHLLV